MNVDNEVEVGLILAHTNILVPDYLTEVWGAVGLPKYTLYERRGWHRERGATAECGSEEILSRGLLHVVHVAMGVDIKCCHVKFNA